MAGFKSIYLRNLYLNALYSGASFDSAIPATIYAAVFTVAPTPAGGGTEWADAGYARVAVLRGTAAYALSTAGQSSNAAAYNFGTPTTGATIVAGGFYDAVTGGNLLDAGEFSPAKTALAGVAFIVPIGAYIATEA